MNESPTSEALGHTDGTALTITRTVPRPLDDLWGALMTPEGGEALLGAGAQLGSKGEDWSAADGTRGVVRSFHPKEQIRFSWHADGDAPATLVEFNMAADDGATELTLRHDHLPADTDRADLESRWGAVLDRVAAL